MVVHHGRYEDEVDVSGEIRAAELKARVGGSFVIRLENGDSVNSLFSNEQESIITEALHQHRRLRLRIRGVGEFDPTRRLRRIVRIDRIEEFSVNSDRLPIWEEIAEISAAIPDEEWSKVPTDLAENLEHYLYGSRKEHEAYRLRQFPRNG